MILLDTMLPATKSPQFPSALPKSMFPPFVYIFAPTLVPLPKSISPPFVYIGFPCVFIGPLVFIGPHVIVFPCVFIGPLIVILVAVIESVETFPDIYKSFHFKFEVPSDILPPTTLPLPSVGTTYGPLNNIPH